MKLIDADAVMSGPLNYEWIDGVATPVSVPIDRIDAAPVVSCGECAHRTDEYENEGECTHGLSPAFERYVGPLDVCQEFERRQS